MERIILNDKGSYIIQEKLWIVGWVDKTAQDDYGNDLPCTYAFDTLAEAIRYSPNAYISGEILAKLIGWNNTKVKTMSINDYVKIIKEGDVDKNHRQLEAEINKLSEMNKKSLIIKMTYMIDALLSK